MSGTSTIEVSSTTSSSQSSGSSSVRRKAPVLGSVSRRRWIVFASSRVLSERRLAARPVGAQSPIATVFAPRILRIDPRDRLVGIYRRPGRLPERQRLELLGDLPFSPIEPGEEQAAPAVQIV